MLTWVREQARKAGCTIVIDRSNVKKIQSLQLDCERGGLYDSRSKKKLKREATGSRKCDCPFSLRGYIHVPNKQWFYTTVNGIHNHKMDSKLEGHINVGRLTVKTKEVVKESAKSLVQPKNILINLKKKYEECDTTLNQVYNARHRLRQAERGDNSELQHLIQRLEEHHYVHFIRTKCDSTTLQDIFWAHPESIKLLNTFSTVLIMDSTYKTNIYRMSLFEIVCVTSTDKTYSVAFAFLANEKAENFTCVLDMLCGLLHSKANTPKVIVTDRDVTLMNVVEIVFRDTIALLCHFRIHKNVRARCILDCKVKPNEGKEVKKSDVVDNIMLAWENVVEPPSFET